MISFPPFLLACFLLFPLSLPCIHVLNSSLLLLLLTLSFFIIFPIIFSRLPFFPVLPHTFPMTQISLRYLITSLLLVPTYFLSLLHTFHHSLILSLTLYPLPPLFFHPVPRSVMLIFALLVLSFTPSFLPSSPRSSSPPGIITSSSAFTFWLGVPVTLASVLRLGWPGSESFLETIDSSDAEMSLELWWSLGVFHRPCVYFLYIILATCYFSMAWISHLKDNGNGMVVVVMVVMVLSLPYIPIQAFTLPTTHNNGTRSL